MKVFFKDAEGAVLFEGEINKTELHKQLFISKEILKKAGNRLKICFSQPIIDIHGYWTSELNRLEFTLPWTLKLNSAAQREMPFLAWLNLDGTNRAAFMLTNLKDDAFLVSQMSQSAACFEIEWTLTLTAETEPFFFVADFEHRCLADTIADFRNRVLPEMPVFPGKAWDPVYCTWYAFHGAYTIPELEKNASAAAKMGFKTFILDDGWSYDTSKRLNPATLSEWFSEDGNWTVSEKKLPDFAGHVKRIQDMGMNYVLWCTLFLVGNKTPLYRELKQNQSILWESDDGSACADPEDGLIETFSIPRILKVFADNNLDGLKIDFVDYVHPEENRPRGRAAFARIHSLVQQLRAQKPEALIEFRQHYCTPVMIPLGTNFRANDVPFDFLENLHRCCQLRMILGDGVPIHADPVSFHPEECCENVARHMISSLAGVPMISADMEAIPARHKNVIQRFVQFYQAHKETFSGGHWSIDYESGRIASLKVETDKEIIATAVTGLPRIIADKDIYLFNLGASEYSITGQSVDSEGNTASALLPGGMTYIPYEH